MMKEFKTGSKYANKNENNNSNSRKSLSSVSNGSSTDVRTSCDTHARTNAQSRSHTGDSLTNASDGRSMPTSNGGGSAIESPTDTNLSSHGSVSDPPADQQAGSSSQAKQMSKQKKLPKSKLVSGYGVELPLVLDL